MPTTIDRTLTILGVKDFLGDALRNASKGLDVVDKKTDGFNSKLDRIIGKSPVLTKALNLLPDPFDLAAAGGTALVGILGAATREAALFNKEFRSNINLNQDKSGAQLEDYRKLLKATAFDAGKSLKEINQGFFDVQSGTGKFGEEVAKINARIATFSTATQSKFNQQIEASVKGMKAFGFGADELDSFLQSNAKTVQTGIITYEQLAAVQSNVFGSAASAGQNFDSANKLISIFTAKTKSADEAATLAKSAFTDLLKPSTLKTFEKLGVRAFDKTTGKIKQVDKIMEQLVGRFKALGKSDRDINNLVNQFSGGEGLRALIGEAAINGDKLLETFRQFDETDFNIDKAFSGAKKDVFVMTEMLRNKTSVILSDIGERVLPIALDFLNKIDGKMPQIAAGAERFFSAVFKTAEQLFKINERIANASGLLNGRNTSRNIDFLEELGVFRTGLAGKIGINDFGLSARQQVNIQRDVTQARELFNQGKLVEATDELTRVLKANGVDNEKLLSAIRQGNLDARLNKLNSTIEKLDKNVTKPPKPTTPPVTPNSPVTTPTTIGTSTPTTARVDADFFGSGRGDRVRNVTLNINNLVGQIKVNMDTDGLTPEQFNSQMGEWLTGVSRNVELTLAAE